ncbi:type IV secretion system protein [Paraburkholderia sp. CNPSo 3274]|uniref:type IV secretion system protein n=1 Tax=unclassified Paraburkholderia TaxID=2615204 RepID=UPI0020B671C9|nr:MULTISPECIES: type IV secretion system protein [unclassified Paraburkholderia]MCP3712466.1 type IV secretion system protein [Paraburkholderia sp. CNPSo 3274]MCP3724628.1 type IV secretion system protein [Paraburkholderia sp. CNPSo 3272]
MRFRQFWACLALVSLGLLASSAWADDSPALGQQITESTGTTVTQSSSGNDTFGSTMTKGEIAAGATKAAAKAASLFAAAIPAAVTVSQSIKSEADKFAAGLGVITLVLTFIRYSATRDPVSAWVTVFEEIGTLGIFASIYVSYQTFAPGFYNWFQTLANMIQSGAGQGVSSSMAAAGGAVMEAVVKAYNGTSWTNYVALTISMFPLLLAYIVLVITSIVFAFMNNLGLIQAAVGIVMGQIAVALGFSSYTRGYFKSWLDYMVSAGMYCVVSAILLKLVATSLNQAIDEATAMGLSTAEGASYVFDLSLFVFLLSFEIPKMAGMFGGGANASGSMMKKAASVATGGIL